MKLHHCPIAPSLLRVSLRSQCAPIRRLNPPPNAPSLLKNLVGAVGNGGGYTTQDADVFANRRLRNESTLYEAGS